MHGSSAYNLLLSFLTRCTLLNSSAPPSSPLPVPPMILVCCYTSISGNQFILGMGSPLFFHPSLRKVEDVGIAEHVGHAMTFKVLADDSQRVLFHSAIHSAIAPGEQNLRIDPLGGELPYFVKLIHDPVNQMPFDPGGQDPDSPPTNEDETKSSQLLHATPLTLLAAPSCLIHKRMVKGSMLTLSKPLKTTMPTYIRRLNGSNSAAPSMMISMRRS